MTMQVGRVTGPVTVNGVVYESPGGVDITMDATGTRVVDAVTGAPVQPRGESTDGGR